LCFSYHKVTQLTTAKHNFLRQNVSKITHTYKIPCSLLNIKQLQQYFEKGM
jgi:hypothetical protein